jgi:hypothetical protein
MKASLFVKSALVGAVLASTLSVAFAAPRDYRAWPASYGYSQAYGQADGQISGDEQRTRDGEANQNG